MEVVGDIDQDMEEEKKSEEDVQDIDDIDDIDGDGFKDNVFSSKKFI
jgi:hypothetical protein